MRADNRMDIGNWVSTNDTASSKGRVRLLMSCSKSAIIISLLRTRHTRMQRLQPMQPLPKLRRQPSVCERLIRKQRITPSSRTVKQIQKRRTWRLLLIRHVRVPRDRVDTVLEQRGSGPLVGAPVHQVDFRVPLGRAGGWVDVVAAKVGAPVQGVGDGEGGEVLVAEGWSAVSIYLLGKLTRD